MPVRVLLAFLSVAASLVAQDPAVHRDPLTHRDSTRGFRIARPAANWKLVPVAGAQYTLQLRPDDTGEVQASVRILSAQQKSTALGLRKLALDRVRHDEAYAELELLDRRLGASDTALPGLRVQYVAPTKKTYVLEQFYAVAYGNRFILQFHAPLAIWPKYAPAFAKVRASFAILKPSADELTRRHMAALADRCGAEIAWQPSWAAAAREAKQAHKLVLVHIRRYRGFALPDLAMTNVFMDPDLVELIGERLVAFHWRYGMAAPFVRQENYGLSPSTFGQSILLLRPSGEVLRVTSSLQPQVVEQFVREALRDLAKDAVASPTAAVLVRRGEFEKARAALRDRKDAAAHRLRATMHRRERHGEAALAALRAAQRAGDDSLGRCLEEVVVLVRMARDRDARELLRERMQVDAAATEDPAALYWRGVCAARTKRATAAAKYWKRLFDHHAKSRWAWMAAALSQGRGGIPFAWPEADIADSLRSSTLAPLPLAAADRAAAGGVAYLLAGQREDGSWISPVEVTRPRSRVPHPFTQAVTALCGRALLQRQKTRGCKAAVERALRYLIAAHDRGKRFATKRSYMDYTVWSRTFVLWFFADCVQQGVGAPDEIRRRMRDLVRDLGDQQLPTGGWSYYVTGDLAQATNATQSISFVTGPVLLALYRAVDVGVRVPNRMLHNATRCLVKMRTDTPTFAYFLHANGERTSTGRPGSAGRGPVCELALRRAGKSSDARMQRIVELFTKFRKGLAKEVGKVLMHAGPGGQGCHYPMFDYAFAAVAIATLPDPQRARHRDRLLELILATRSKAGAFRDTQFNGWEYGTAMALLAFHALGVR